MIVPKLEAQDYRNTDTGQQCKLKREPELSEGQGPLPCVLAILSQYLQDMQYHHVQSLIE